MLCLLMIRMLIKDQVTVFDDYMGPGFINTMQHALH